MNNNDTPENVHRAKLLDRRAIPLTPGDIPVRTDVLIHNLDRFRLEALRRAMMQGLTSCCLDFTGDEDDSCVIIRFTRPSASYGRRRILSRRQRSCRQGLRRRVPVKVRDGTPRCAPRRKRPGHGLLLASRIGGEGRWRPELLTTGIGPQTGASLATKCRNVWTAADVKTSFRNTFGVANQPGV